jgi:autotransporter passenger strand-loop-strand repeat protein
MKLESKPMTVVTLSSGVTSTVDIASGSTLVVSSGGVSSESVISSGGLEVVSSSGLSEFDLLSGGSMSLVGLAVSATVEANGALEVFQGGLASGALVSSGGELHVFSFGSATETTIDSGGDVYVDINGAVSGTTIDSGGSMTVIASATNTAVEAGGVLLVKYGASEFDTVSGVESVVGAGVTSTTVLSGGELILGGYQNGPGSFLLSGGASDLVASSGAEVIVSAGAINVGAVLSGATLTLLAAASQANSAVVSSGASAQIASGVISSGQAIVYSSGLQTQGVTIDGVLVHLGASLSVGAFSIAPGGTLSLGASRVFSGAIAVSSAGSLDGPGEFAGGSSIQLVDYGTISGVQLGDGGGGIAEVFVASTGVIDAATLIDGDITLGSGAHATGTILSGGVQYLDENGVAVSTQILSGGLQQVAYLGSAAFATVSSGGQMSVATGGAATSATVADGGLEWFETGAQVQGTVFLSGATAVLASAVVSHGQISAGGLVSQTMIVDGAHIDVGAVFGFQDVQVGSGGRLILHAQGVADQVMVYSGGVLEGAGAIEGIGIDQGGLVSGCDITAGGAFDEESGKLEGVRVGGALGSGSLVVGTVADGLRLEDGVVSVGDGLSPATVSGAYIHGGDMIIYAGAIASATTVSAGGLLLLSGGIASGAVVHGGAALSGSGLVSGSLEGMITDGGRVSAATVLSGGVLEVLANARAGLILVDSGGQALLSAGAITSDMTTVYGGQLVDNGTVTYSISNTLGGDLAGDGVLVQSGRGTLIQSGDASGFAGHLVISGGIVELKTASAFGSADIAFAAGAGTSAVLQFAAAPQPVNGATFGEALLNFAAVTDEIDLRKQAFVSGASATLSGDTLTLVDGAYTARFTLSGSTAAGYVVTNDGHGGALITAAAPGAMAFTHALATFGGSVGVTEGAVAHDTARRTSGLEAVLKPR